jgi:hypothetical protein
MTPTWLAVIAGCEFGPESLDARRIVLDLGEEVGG